MENFKLFKAFAAGCAVTLLLLLLTQILFQAA